jgi:hypothetical protein
MLFAALLTWGQSGGGGLIQGIVKDSTGSVIPGAKVLINHTPTNRTVNLETAADGFFASPPSAIGPYKVRVEAAGMKAWEGTLNLEVGRTAVIEPVLLPGAVSETIQVTETVPLVTVTDPTDASTLDSKRIKELPINGRNLNTLLENVAPGVEALGDINGGVRVSGLMSYSTDYIQDGASSNNREFGGSANLQGLESIGEVRVETSTSSAKYTRPTSIIVSTKSGTNRLSLAVFETHRNNAFGVARARQDVFLDGTPFKTPKLIRNEFGGSIGGPIMLPTFGLGGKQFYNGRNRSFFFFTQEGVELRQGVTRDFRVPLQAMRQGDFSGLFDDQGRFLQLYDPQTTRQEEQANGRIVSVRDPFSNNQIPMQRMSEFAKRIFAITPLPTDITNPLVASNLRMAVPTSTYPNVSDNPRTIKLDHRFTEKDNFFIKYNGGLRSGNFMGTATNNGVPSINGEANVTYLPVRSRAVATS